MNLSILNKQIKLFFLIILCLACSNTVFCQFNPADNLIKTGNDYTNLFQYDKAYENYKKAADIDPTSWEAWFGSGKSLLKLKRIDEAEKCLQKAHSINPRETDVQKALGSIYINLAKNAQTNGNTTQKIDYQLKACHAYPAASKIWLSLFEHWWENNEHKKIKSEGDFLYKNNQLLLDQGEDTSFQKALIYVAKSYYRDNELSKADLFLNYASKIRESNDELYALKREIKNKTDDKIKDVLAVAQKEINNHNYERALDILNNAAKQPGGHSALIDEKIDFLQKEIAISKYTNQIQKLISSSKYDEAYTKLDEALQNYPENEKLLDQYNIVTKKLEEIEAKEEAEKEKLRQKQIAKENKEFKIRSLKAKAKTYEEKKDYDQALKLLKEVKGLAPNDDDIKALYESVEDKKQKHLERERAFSSQQKDLENSFNSQDYEESVKSAEEIVLKYPEYKARAATILVESYIKLENYNKASYFTAHLSDSENDKLLSYFANGMNLYRTGNNASASELLEKVKSSSSVYNSIAKKTVILIFLQKVQIGIYIFLLAVLLYSIPKVKEHLKNQKILKNQKLLDKIKESGSYEANFEFLKERYEKEDLSNMKLVTLLYAAALQKKGQLDTSYKLIVDYLKRDTRSPLARNIAGECAMALNDTSPAGLEFVQGLLKLNENRKDVVNYLAKTYISMNADHKLSQEFILKYLTLNPNDTEALAYLADVYIRRQSYSQQTVKTFEKAIKAYPDKSDYYVALMENYKSLGDTDNAEKMLSLIKEKFPSYFEQAKPSYGNYDDYGYDNQYASNSNYSQQTDYYSQPQQTATSQAMPNNDYYSNMSSTDNNDFSASMKQQELLYQQPAMQPSNNTNTGNNFPDYDSIGNAELPNLDNLGDDLYNQPVVNVPPTTTQQQASFSGPKKNCPHCGAANPAGEYYCNSCGKPF